MRKLFHTVLKTSISALTLLGTVTGCVTNDELPDDPQGNFEALWRIMDEHYCFFSQKGVDWQEVHSRYARQFDASMTAKQQFEVMTNMLSELKDGHVNLYTSFNIGRYWAWHEDYPKNYSDSLERRYLKTDYLIASGMDYTILDDNIGYLRCESFQNGIGAGNLDDILLHLQLLVGYMQHKTGKGHDDFSSLRPEYLKPGRGVRWQKPVVVLTNRSVFSAANEFVKYMKCCPGITVVGDRTGGGAGLPFSSELPNGWGVRFSACPMYDRDKKMTEFGIDPDHKVDLTSEDFARSRDTIIEFARELLKTYPNSSK